MVRFHHTMDTNTVRVLRVAVEGKLVGYLVVRREKEKGREKVSVKEVGEQRRGVEREERGGRGVTGSGKEKSARH